ncbi:MAG: sugar isomerase [Clostridiales bacterium]|nr:sugar isomerase [Clostridiales bacterium]
MRSRLKFNTFSSLLFEVVSIVSGFILPRLILGQYGSDVNGLVNSITQFIGIITFLELGVGKVVQSSLYKPLTEHDDQKISQIMTSAGRFFRRIALIMLAYICVLIVFYPLVIRRDFGWIYTATLIAAMSISSFAQYYFGVVNRLLLVADQKGYISYTAQTVTLVLNTVACVILIKLNMSIHAVRLTTSLIFMTRPLFLAWYVKRHYHVDHHATYDVEPIKQKWNGMAQHIAYTILNDTDTIVLTMFASLADVSIYSVYHLVVYGVKRLFTSMTNGIEAMLGHLWAKQEKDRLDTAFAWTEWVIHTGVVLVFGCTLGLILPFVQVYTHGVTDANYQQPLFAALIVLAHACHCLRLPYNMMIFVAGHYKQTQSNYIISAAMNIVISVLTVKLWGLVGVAIGTLVAMLYQTVWMAWYNSGNLLKRPMKHFIKQILVDAGSFAAMYLASGLFTLRSASYLSWLVIAVECFILYFAIVFVINLVFYRKQLAALKDIALRRLKRS